VKVLITGSNGLLGQKLLRLLLAEPNIELLATSFGEDRTKNVDKAYRYQSLDITKKESVDHIIDGFNPEVVINTAAMTQVDQCETDREKCWEINVEALSYLCEACVRNDTFLVHLSTDFIFNGENGPYREEDIPDPISYYGESKLASEEVVLKSSVKSAILRTVLVYGFERSISRMNIVLWVRSKLMNNEPIKVVTDQWRTPTLAEDLAMACYLSAKKKENGVFHISGEEMMTPHDIARQVARYFKLNEDLITAVDGTVFTQPAKRPPKTGFIIDKAKEVLKFQPRSFESGLALIAAQLNS
jgi:dTDP-4-dehydrorhamnose reductase